MSDLTRLYEIQHDIGVIVSNGISAHMGTDKEREFMNLCMDAGLAVVRKLRDLVEVGLTFDIWKTYYINESINNELMDRLDNEDGDLKKLHAEVAAMDLTEYYETDVVPHATLEALNTQVEQLVENHAMLREIWAEEDEEDGLVEVRDPHAPAFDPDLELHFDSTLVEKD